MAKAAVITSWADVAEPCRSGMEVNARRQRHNSALDLASAEATPVALIRRRPIR